ncbi:MAG: hypothetical protein KC486_05335 [Myxococcales bacterium]|nr:hypothetical protein [Myxococcales bacterium]
MRARTSSLAAAWSTRASLLGASLVAASTLACTSTVGEPQPAKPATPAATADPDAVVVTPEPTPPRVPVPFACAEDHDCVASCSQGAVSRAWYRDMFPGGEGCEDGCTRKGTDAPRCEAGRCVAYHQGARDPQCTAREDVATAPLRPGPAHQCARDDECRLSCAFGAIRQDWYEWRGLRAHECRDGCSSIGMDVRCADGYCQTTRLGEPYPGCDQLPTTPE